MKVLVVGGGGREHALAWKIAQSPKVEEVLCAPGNAGTAALARNVPVSAGDIRGLLDLALGEKVDLTVVGPEAPLVDGIVDLFEAEGLSVFGPSREAARLEGSKVFTKEFAVRHGIPTGEFAVFEDHASAEDYLRSRPGPVVVKADGLAAGKGVLVCDTPEEALSGLREIMIDGVFGAAGRRVIIEERLYGDEISVLALCDGEDYLLLAPAQDHKRALDGDRGPNTGGMGVYSPAPWISPQLLEEIHRKVIHPALDGAKREGFPFKGVLYAGLMLTARGPMLLEFNCRFGDPETQAILPRLEGDIVTLLEAAIGGRLKEARLEWKDEASVCVVMASGGYPGPYEKGKVITGLAEAEATGALVFHAGTGLDAAGRTVTAGGRVLGVTALGKTVDEAADKAYRAAGMIDYEGRFFRKDIGKKARKEGKD